MAATSSSSKLNLLERQVPMVSNLALLGQLRVPTASGPSQITITVDLKGMAMGEVEKQIDALPALQDLPPCGQR